jgi:hypothetical protein
MRFYVKCVQCGRVTGVQCIEPVSTTSEEFETHETAVHLSGYIVNCPACSPQQSLRHSPDSVRSEVAAILTEADRLSA